MTPLDRAIMWTTILSLAMLAAAVASQFASNPINGAEWLVLPALIWWACLAVMTIWDATRQPPGANDE